MTLNANNGQMSGTPTQSGNISLSIQVKDSSSTPHAASKAFSVTIAAASTSPVSITTSSLANGQIGTTYSATVAATGGTTPYSWSISSGSLPNGLSLNSSSGQISGTPSLAGSFAVTVQVKDSSATPQTASKSFSITIAGASTSPVSITTPSLANGQVGTAYTATVAATGGTTPYSWSVTSGSLPNGLTLSSSSGQISGTPTQSGTVSFSVQVKDSSATAQTAMKSLSINVAAAAPNPVSITTSSLASATVGAAYSATLAATGGTTPYTWSVSTGALPAGLTLSASSGQISGTPTQSGNVSFTVQVKDSSAPTQTATKAYSIAVVSSGPTPLQLITTSVANGQVSVAYSAALVARGGVAPYTWSVGSGALPTGLTLGASNGQISGTPTAPGSFPFTIQVKDSSSPAQMANQSFTVAIIAATAGTPVTACGTLGNSGTTYVLQNDVSAAGTCFTLSASGITLNLNGHTVTYNTGASTSVFGVTASSLSSIQGIHITSGTIAESTACKINLATQPNTAAGCNAADPIFVGGFVEVDHVTVVDYGLDNQAIHTSGGNSISIHDNTVCPYHTKNVLNHYSVFGEIAVINASGNISVNNNTVGTTCMSVTGQPNGFGYVGIFVQNPGTATGILQITNNQVSMASPVRDAYGVEFLCANATNINFEVAFNTINQVSGRGIVASGDSSPSGVGCGLGTIHDNTVTIKEAGNEGSGSGDSIGIQARFGAHDIQVFNNTVTLNVGLGACPAQFFTDNGSDCGGIGIKLSEAAPGGGGANLTATNNTVTSISNSANFVAAGIYGVFTADSNSFFKNNIVSSNSSPITVDPPGSNSGFDGCGRNWLFQGNTITKLPNPQGYFTFTNLWYCTPTQTGGQDTTGNVFIDNTYNGGAAPDDIGPTNTAGAPFSYTLKWSYNLRLTNSLGNPIPNASVTAVATGGGSETVSGTTDVNGMATLVVTQHFVSGTSFTSQTTTDFTPHNFTISKTGCTTLTYGKGITSTTSDSQILQGSGCS